MNLFHISPLALDFKLGRELNKHIECFPDDSWILITDRDTMFLGDNYAKIIHEAINDNQDAELLTCWTNRLKNKNMCFGGKINEDTNIIQHYVLSKSMEQLDQIPGFEKYTVLKEKHIAAMMWLFPKSTWIKNKFDEGMVLQRGGKSFDMRWTEQIDGKKIMINRLYIFHYYRMHKSILNFDHLKH